MSKSLAASAREKLLHGPPINYGPVARYVDGKDFREKASPKCEWPIGTHVYLREQLPATGENRAAFVGA